MCVDLGGGETYQAFPPGAVAARKPTQLKEFENYLVYFARDLFGRQIAPDVFSIHQLREKHEAALSFLLQKDASLEYPLQSSAANGVFLAIVNEVAELFVQGGGLRDYRRDLQNSPWWGAPVGIFRCLYLRE